MVHHRLQVAARVVSNALISTYQQLGLKESGASLLSERVLVMHHTCQDFMLSSAYLRAQQMIVEGRNKAHISLRSCITHLTGYAQLPELACQYYCHKATVDVALHLVLFQPGLALACPGLGQGFLVYV